MPALTIGMATYNDFDGVYFTVQSLRFHHDLADTESEFVIVDNYGCETTRDFVEGIHARYILATDAIGTAAPRDRVFREATGDAVLCCDSHILFAPGAITRVIAYHQAHPDSRDLLQGPLVYDDTTSISTHFDPVWNDQMWGTWGTDPRGEDPAGEPFEIPMQGLGVFSCRRAAWPGFNPLFRGFGGEEGYLHEKFRQRGGRCLCLPGLRWMHRFGRPAGVPYRLTVEDKLRNYVIGFTELGLDLIPVISHFSEHLPQQQAIEIAADALREAAGVSLAVAPGQTTVAPNRDGTRPTTSVRPAIARQRSAAPMVSCLCMTYGRPPEKQFLLEEAIESFLRQDYPHKELIVINDAPGQELICKAPGVRIINHHERFATLGEKSNYAVALSRGDLIAPWDDDDISLHWRLTRSVELLGDADYYNPRRYWFIDESGLHADHAMGVGHNCSLITHAAFDAIGGYAPISLGYDAEIEERIARANLTVVDPLEGAPVLPLNDWFYIYRWGVSPHHVSSQVREDFYAEIGEILQAPGRFTLTPHWRSEYDLDIRTYDGPPPQDP